MDERQRKKRDGARRQRAETEARQQVKKTNLHVTDKCHAPRRPPRPAASDHGALGINNSRLSSVGTVMSPRKADPPA